MGDQLSILLRAKLDNADLKDINLSIDNLSKNPNLAKLKLKIDVDEQALTTLNKRIQEIQTTLSKGINVGGASASTPKILPQLDANDIENRVKRITNSLDRLKVGKDKVFADTRVSSEVFKLDDMVAQFRRGEISSKDLSLQMDTLRTRVSQVSGEFKNVNKDGYGFSEMLTLAAKKMIIWKVAGDAVFAALGLLKQIPEIVSEIDKSLTEINKILDLTTSRLKDLAVEATKIGIEYGQQTVKILDSIGAFAKAGLDENTSKQFAQLAALLSNVGDISAETAQQTLIMANAGYQLGNNYGTLNTLISQFNELANRNAVEVNTLAEAWQMSASMAKQAKLDISDYNALITVAGSVSQRSGKEVGNALRTWFMRLQGVSDGADTLEEDISKVDKVLGDLGIQLRESPTKFRPAMQVITEIAAKYRELGEAGETVKQSELLEALAGKYRANIVAGVLQNFDQITKAIDDQTNSFQSAEKENARYMNSIQAKSKQLAAQWELFASKTLDSGVIKAIVDFGRVLIQLLDSGFVRFIATVALVTTATWGLSSAFTAVKASTLGTAIGVFALDSAEKGLLVTSKALWATLSVSPFFWIATATAAIYGIVKVVDALTVSVEEQKEIVNELKEEYDSLSSSLEENESKQKNVIDRLKELYDLRNTNKITDAEKEELTRLENVNTELQRQIEYEKTLKTIRGEALERETLELSDKKIYRSRTQIPEIKQGRSYELPPMLTLSEKAQEDIQIINEYTTKINDLEKAFDNGEISAEAYKKKLDELTTSRRKEILSLEELITKLQDENKNYVGNYEEANKKKAANEIIIKSAQDLIIALNGETEAIEELGKSNKESFYEQAKSAEELAKIYDEANDSIKDLSSSGKELSSIFKDVAEGEKLSTDQLISLIGKYPEMAAQILSINNSKEQGISITNLLWEVEKQRSIAKIKADRDELISEQTKLEGYRRAYQALASIMGVVPKEIQEGLSQYNNITNQINGLTAAIDTLQNSKLSDYTSKSTLSKSKYTPSTEQQAIKELLDAEKITLQEYYNRLLALEQSQYSDYADKSASQLEQMLRSKDEKLAKKTEEYLSLSTEHKQVKTKLIDIAFDATITPLIDSLDDLKFAFDNLADDELTEKLNNISQQMKIQKELVYAYTNEIANLNNEYNNGNITKDNYTNSLLDLEKNLKKANQATIELSNSTKELTKTQIDNYTKTAEDLAKSILEVQKSIDKAALEAFKSSSDARIDSYQREINALQEKNDLITEQEERAEHLLNIQKAQVALQDAQNNKNTKILRQKEDGTYYWSMESDPKAVKDAQDNLKKVQEDYTTWQRNVNLKKQKKYWQDLIQQEKDAQKEQEDLFNKHYANVEHLTTTYLDNLKTTYGDKWDEIIAVQEDKLKRLQDNYAKMVSIDTSKANYLSDSTISSGSSSNKSQSTSGLNPDKLEQMAKNSAEWHSADDKKKAELAAENLKIGTEMGLTRSSGGIWYDKNGKRVYDTGGMLPHGGSAVNLSGKPERILSPEQTKNFDRLIKELPNLIKALDITKIVMPKINIPNIPAIAGNNNGLSNGTVYNIHVDKVVANDGKQFINTLTRMVHIQ